MVLQRLLSTRGVKLRSPVGEERRKQSKEPGKTPGEGSFATTVKSLVRQSLHAPCSIRHTRCHCITWCMVSIVNNSSRGYCYLHMSNTSTSHNVRVLFTSVICMTRYRPTAFFSHCIISRASGCGPSSVAQVVSMAMTDDVPFIGQVDISPIVKL